MDYTKQLSGSLILSHANRYQHKSGVFDTGQNLSSPDVREKSTSYSQGESRGFGVNIHERNILHGYTSPDVDTTADDICYFSSMKDQTITVNTLIC